MNKKDLEIKSIELNEFKKKQNDIDEKYEKIGDVEELQKKTETENKELKNKIENLKKLISDLGTEKEANLKAINKIKSDYKAQKNQKKLIEKQISELQEKFLKNEKISVENFKLRCNELQANQDTIDLQK